MLISAGFMRETNHEGEQDSTDNHYSSVLSIYATHYVLMSSVGVSYKAIHFLHMVMGTMSGTNLCLKMSLPSTADDASYITVNYRPWQSKTIIHSRFKM